MEHQKFNINTKIGWFLAIINFVIIFIAALAKIKAWEFSQGLSTFGIILYFLTWGIFLIDILRCKIYNKTFWVLSMFIMPSIAIFFYLIQKDRLLRLGQKLS